jgi:hypothetical protein
MKKLLRFLVIPVLVLPFFIPSKVSAFGGPGTPYGFQDRERYRDASAVGRMDAEQTYLQRFETNRGNRFTNNDDPTAPPTASTPPVPGGENAPIDGGISLLLAAGLGLGVKKAFRKKKTSDQDNNETAG